MDNNNKVDSKVIDSLLKRELEAPTGLSLLVAALDAQDPKAFRIQGTATANTPLLAMPSANGRHERLSDSPVSATNGTVNGRRRSIPDNDKTEAYWEKRRRNNEAAKRSREKRRYNDMIMEAKLLELSKENNVLKHELDTVKVLKPPAQTFPPVLPVVAPTTAHPHVPLPGSIASVMPQLGAALCGASMQLPPTGPSLLSPVGLTTNPLLASVVNPIFLQAAAAAHHHRLQQTMSEPQSPCVKQQSPDSTAGSNSFDDTTAQSLQLLNGSNSLLDGGKQYLRYKLLERQSRLTPGSTLLGSLAASTAAGPLLYPSLISPSVTKTEADSLSLKDCLSSLAVTLGSPKPLLNHHSSSNQSSPHSDHGYDTQDRDHNSSGDTSCGDSSSGECGARSHTPGSLSEEGYGGAELRTAKKRSASPCLSVDDDRNNEPHINGNYHSSSSIINGHGLDSSVSGGGNETERYIERRRRNNEAAKRCRANRRALFEFRFQRAQELEHENNKLKDSIKQLTDEVNELKNLLAKKQQQQNNNDDNVDCSQEFPVNSDTPLDFSKKKFE